MGIVMTATAAATALVLQDALRWDTHQNVSFVNNHLPFDIVICASKDAKTTMVAYLHHADSFMNEPTLAPKPPH
jgi:hypothetical protein